MSLSSSSSSPIDVALDAALLSESMELRRREYGDGKPEDVEFGDHGSHCAGGSKVERARMALL